MDEFLCAGSLTLEGRSLPLIRYTHCRPPRALGTSRETDTQRLGRAASDYGGRYVLPHATRFGLVAECQPTDGHGRAVARAA